MKKISGKIVDVGDKKIFDGEICYHNGKIISVVPAKNVTDQYIMPGFVNSHVHIESTMLTPSAFARIAVQHGTVAVVSDPHEIAKVRGERGIDFMIDDSRKVPVKFYFGLPSCVPASDFETSGFHIDAKDTARLLKRKDIHYLSEMMNFPGVVNGDSEIEKKLSAARKLNKPVDGHAPGLKGKDLKKYVAAGISTDHECVDINEAVEKIKAGMKIQIRDGSAAKNFEALHKLIDLHPDHVMICTDDSHPDDLINGHINEIVKNGLKNGLDLFNVLRAASYNTIKHYNLKIGMLKVNDPADFIVVDNLKDLNISKTVISGKTVYENGKTKFKATASPAINNFIRTKIKPEAIKFVSNEKEIPVIEVIDGELLTLKKVIKNPAKGKNFESDIKNDVLKIVVACRYNNEKPAWEFIKNFGLKKGAIAGSIAHDSHNLVAIGTNDSDICQALNKIVEMKGGIALAEGKMKNGLMLEIGGLMTNMNCYELAEKYKKIENNARNLGSKLKAPFMTMAFMTLLPIPEIKICDKGLFDVGKQKFI